MAFCGVDCGSGVDYVKTAYEGCAAVGRMMRCTKECGERQGGEADGVECEQGGAVEGGLFLPGEQCAVGGVAEDEECACVEAIAEQRSHGS